MKLKSYKASVAIFAGTMLLAALAVVPVLAQRAGDGPGQPGRGPMARQGGMGHPGHPGMNPQAREMMGQKMQERMHKAMGKMLLTPMAQEKLALTDEQVKQIKQKNFEGEKQNIELDAEQKLAHLELQQLMSEEEPNREAIMGQIERIGMIEIHKRQLDVSKNLDLREVLTAEQREKIEQFRGEMMKRHMQQGPRPSADQREKMERGRKASGEKHLGREGRGGWSGRKAGADDDDDDDDDDDR